MVLPTGTKDAVPRRFLLQAGYKISTISTYIGITIINLLWLNIGNQNILIGKVPLQLTRV
jgi:hypothetical protein